MDHERVKAWLDKAENNANDEIFCCEHFTPEVEKLIAVARAVLFRLSKCKYKGNWHAEMCACRHSILPCDCGADEVISALSALTGEGEM